jgi:hypothetical protein
VDLACYTEGGEIGLKVPFGGPEVYAVSASENFQAVSRRDLLGNCSKGPECNAFGFLAVCLTKVCLIKTRRMVI